MVQSQVPPSSVKAQPVKLGTCTYTVQAKYISKKAVSKAYDIILMARKNLCGPKKA